MMKVLNKNYMVIVVAVITLLIGGVALLIGGQTVGAAAAAPQPYTIVNPSGGATRITASYDSSDGYLYVADTTTDIDFCYVGLWPVGIGEDTVDSAGRVAYVYADRADDCVYSTFVHRMARKLHLGDIWATDALVIGQEYQVVVGYSSQAEPYGGTVTLMPWLYTFTFVYDLPEAPTKEGFDFVGWFYDEGCTEPYDGRPITEDVTLYAGYEQIMVEFVLVLRGGNTTALDGQSFTFSVPWGTPIGTPGSNAGFNKSLAEYIAGNNTPLIYPEYIFNEQYYSGNPMYIDRLYDTADDNVWGIYYNSGQITEEHSGAYYLPYWRSLVIVTFDFQYGKDLLCVDVKYGSDYNFKVNDVYLTDFSPERVGYTFGGWYLDPACTISRSGALVKVDMTYYAKWEPLPCTVTFIVDGVVFKTLDVYYGMTLGEVIAMEPSLINFNYYADTAFSTALTNDTLVDDVQLVYATPKSWGWFAQRGGDIDWFFNVFLADNWGWFVVGGVALVLIIGYISQRRGAGQKGSKYARR